MCLMALPASTAHTSSSLSKVHWWLGATRRKWPFSEAFCDLKPALCLDRKAGFSNSQGFTFTNLTSPLTAPVQKSVLSFGPELKEGSEKGVKNSREGKLSHS